MWASREATQHSHIPSSIHRLARKGKEKFKEEHNMHNLNIVLPLWGLLGIGGIICLIRSLLAYATACVAEADRRTEEIIAARRAKR